MKVLVVEDSIDMLSLYEEALGRRGHEVIGARGRRLPYERLPVDVAVIDYTLPKKTGVEVLTDLRGAQPGLPAVFVTATTAQYQIEDIASTGCVMVRKPFGFSELLAALDLAVGNG